MKLKRLKNESSNGLYHVFNCATGAFLFTDDVKTQFRKSPFQVSFFCYVDVITCAIMTDHFHILAKVPAKETPVSETKIIGW